MSILLHLADIAEDLLLYGMTPPRAPARSYFDVRRRAAARIGFDAEASPHDEDDIMTRPRPQNWRDTEGREFMWQSIRLVLLARRLMSADNDVSKPLADALFEKANWIFDAYCRETPRWVAMQWLLDTPPPPPHWETAIQHAIFFIEAGAKVGGVFGAQIERAGARMIQETLELDMI